MTKAELARGIYAAEQLAGSLGDRKLVNDPDWMARQRELVAEQTIELGPGRALLVRVSIEEGGSPVGWQPPLMTEAAGK